MLSQYYVKSIVDSLKEDDPKFNLEEIMKLITSTDPSPVLNIYYAIQICVPNSWYLKAILSATRERRYQLLGIQIWMA